MVLSFFKEAPFTDVLWSAPCQQSTLVFSGKYDGSCLPLWPIGENVPGLIDHPDWPRVRELMKLLPYQVHVLCTKLETISPMARSRLFFLFSPSSSTPDWASLVLSPKDWLLELGIYHHFWKNQLFSLRNRKGCCLKGHCSQWHNVWLPTTIASWTVRRLSPNGRQ